VTEDWKGICYENLNNIRLLSQKKFGEADRNCGPLLVTSSHSGNSGFNVRCPDGGCFGILQFLQSVWE
jgi:hypothetical protein